MVDFEKTRAPHQSSQNQPTESFQVEQGKTPEGRKVVVDSKSESNGGFFGFLKRSVEALVGGSDKDINVSETPPSPSEKVTSVSSQHLLQDQENKIPSEQISQEKSFSDLSENEILKMQNEECLKILEKLDEVGDEDKQWDLLDEFFNVIGPELKAFTEKEVSGEDFSEDEKYRYDLLNLENEYLTSLYSDGFDQLENYKKEIRDKISELDMSIKQKPVEENVEETPVEESVEETAVMEGVEETVVEEGVEETAVQASEYSVVSEGEVEITISEEFRAEVKSAPDNATRAKMIYDKFPGLFERGIGVKISRRVWGEEGLDLGITNSQTLENGRVMPNLHKKNFFAIAHGQDVGNQERYTSIGAGGVKVQKYQPSEQLLENISKIQKQFQTSVISAITESGALIKKESEFLRGVEKKGGEITKETVEAVKKFSDAKHVKFGNVISNPSYQLLSSSNDKLVAQFKVEQKYATLTKKMKGDLFNIIDENPDLFAEKKEKAVMDLILGLGEMHNKNCVHRDLKPENVLWDDEGFYLADPDMIHDFDQHKEISEESRFAGTPQYMAPEIYTSSVGPRSIQDWQKTDIFSLGVMLIVMECRTMPDVFSIQRRRGDREHYRPEKDITLRTKLLNEKNPYHQLLLKMVSRNPKERPTIEEVKKACEKHLSIT